MDKIKIPEGFFDFMDGFCEAFDDLPDGAWQECCKEGVLEYNKEFKTNIDSHDGWLAWVFAKDGGNG